MSHAAPGMAMIAFLALVTRAMVLPELTASATGVGSTPDAATRLTRRRGCSWSGCCRAPGSRGTGE